MITTKSGLKILFKHSTVHALEEKAFRQANEASLYDGFALNRQDLAEYNSLLAGGKIGRTLCTILNAEDEVLFKGQSLCDEKDVYRKDKGCFVSIENATKEAPKDLRAEVFDAFSNRKLNTKGKVLVDGKYYDEQVLKTLIDAYIDPVYHVYGDGQIVTVEHETT